MKPLNITFRLGAVFGLLLAALSIVGWQGISHLRRLDAQMQKTIYDRWTEQQLSHQAFQLAAQNSQLTVQVFLMDDTNALQAMLAQRAANIQRINELIKAIEPRLDAAKEKELFAAVKAARTPYLESYHHALALLMEQKREAAIHMMINEARPKLLVYQDTWNAFDQYQAGAINAVLRQSQSDFAEGQWNLLNLLAIAGLMAAGIASFTIRRINREMAVRQRAEKYLKESRALEARLVERTLQLARTNERLAETSALLDALLANTPDDIYFKDLQSRFVHFSPAMLKGLGLAAPADLAGRTDFDFFAVEHARPAFETEQEIIRTGQPVLNLEEKEVYLDGRVEWVLTSKMPWRDPAGTIIGTMGISHDITKRKRAEEILQESEARFTGAFEHAPAGMALVAPGGRWLKVNRALCNMTGYAEAELLARTFQDITHTEDLGACVEHVRQLFAGEIHFCQSEKRYIHANGNPVPVTFNLSLVRDGQSQPLYLIAQIQDITERRAAEVVLKELAERTERRERMLTTTLSALNDFAYIFDREGRFLFANQPLLNLWGITLEAAVGKNFFELGYPDDLARKLQSQVQQVFETKQSVTDETPYASPTGVTGCYEYIFSPAVAADGTVDFVAGSTRDITARKQAEAALRESEERFSNAFRYAPIGVALVALDGRWLKVNRAICDMTGYAEAELLTRTFQDITHPEDLGRDLESLRAIIAGEIRSYKMEKRYVHAHGHFIAVLLNVSLMRDGQGQPLYFISQIQDITERKMAEEALQESELRHRSLFENILEGYCYCRLLYENGRACDYIYLAVNSAFAPQTNLSDVVGKRVSEVVPGMHQANPEQLEIYSRVAATGRPERFETHAKKIDTWFAVSVYSHEPGHFVAVFDNITERKRAEAALQRQSAELRVLFDLVPAMIWFKDKHNGFLRVNRRVAETTGMRIEEIEGKSAYEIFPNQADGYYADDLEVIRLGAPKMGIVEKLAGPQGQERWVQTDKVPVRDEAGNITGLIAMVHDITEQKRVATALQESQLFLRSTLDALSAHIAILDEQGTIVEVNAAWNCYANENGFAGERCLGINYLKVCDAATADCAAGASVVGDGIRNVMAGRSEEFLFEYPCPGPRKQNWFMLRVTRFNGDGPVRVVIAHENITEQKRAEESLRVNEERFRGMFTSAAAGIAISTPHGRFLKANAAYCKMLGYTEEELQLRNFASLTHPEDLTLNLKLRDEMLAGQRESFVMEKRYLKKNGDIVWTRHSVSAARAPAGGIATLIVVAEDITERKRAEESLVLFRTLIDQSNDAIEVIEPETLRFLDINEGACVSLGYSRKELLALSVFNIDTGISPALREKIGKELQTTGFITFESRHRRKDGTTFEVEVNLKSVQLDKGYVVSTVRDITERKKLETQMVQSQKMETVGKLAGGIAHEFNSILTAIMGQSELLRSDLPAGSPLIQNATEIGKAAARAATLTRQLLAYGRKQLLQPEDLDLNRVITNLEGMLKHLLGADIDVRIIPAMELQTVKADTGQIEQVIMNIAVNARDAMPNGGKLTLETANATLDQEYLNRFPASEVIAGNYVMLAITDTGVGMSDAVKGRLFEPFFSTKGVGQGTGLGLSTCYGIVKQSGGHISVYSEQGRGTTFKIYLPQAGVPAKISLRLVVPNLPQGTETILLVEDDPALRAMSATLLKRLGYTVLTAANGIEALSVQDARSHGHIDLLFTDVVMPHMSGRELADRVRTSHPQTKILFASAYTENAILHQGALDKGAALLQKPFTPAALANKLRELLDQAKPVAN